MGGEYEGRRSCGVDCPLRDDGVIGERSKELRLETETLRRALLPKDS